MIGGHGPGLSLVPEGTAYVNRVRDVLRRRVVTSDGFWPVKKLRVLEEASFQHTLFECEAFEEERKVFLSRLYSVCPLARQLNDEYRCRLVMGDKLPREIENPLYRYLIAISRLRLGILTERGEGS